MPGDTPSKRKKSEIAVLSPSPGSPSLRTQEAALTHLINRVYTSAYELLRISENLVGANSGTEAVLIFPPSTLHYIVDKLEKAKTFPMLKTKSQDGMYQEAVLLGPRGPLVKLMIGSKLADKDIMYGLTN